MKRTTAFAAVLLLAAQPAPAAEDWRFGLAADLLHDDNATRGLFDGKEADNILSLEGSATRSMQLGARTGATFGVKTCSTCPSARKASHRTLTCSASRFPGLPSPHNLALRCPW